MKTEIQVKCVTKQMDWATGKNKEIQVPLIVDADMVHKFQNITVKNLSDIPRDKSKHVANPQYVIVAAGSSQLGSGERSLASWIFGVKPGTRKNKGFASNEFTREAYGLI